VVPSRQRAEAVRLAHARAALHAGQRVWASPDVLPFDAWLHREIEAVAESRQLPRLLAGAQEWLLWRQCTATAADALPLITRGALAEGLRRASALADEYGIALRAGGSEADLLCQVRGAVQERCHALSVNSARELARALTCIGDERSVEFAGFLSQTPFVRALSAARERCGYATQFQQAEGGAERAVRIACADRSEEFERIAGWCRKRLRQSPQARLLIVFPGAPAARERLALFVQQALDAPGWLSGMAEPSHGLVAIEGGESLARAPLVAHALTSLSLLVGALDFETLSAWLCAPYWRAPDALGRARIDLWLRRVAPLELDAASLRELLAHDPRGRHGAALAPARELAARLAAAAAHLEWRSGAPRDWAVRLSAALEALGWPGAELTSSAQQARQSFTELLSEFGELTIASRSFRREEALQVFKELAARATFRPASGDAPVLVTPFLEDPIIRYSGICVAGLDASTWPEPVQPNAFLPAAAQRAANIPAASMAGRTAQARALMRAWRSRADELIFSICAREEDTELAPSPLVEKWTSQSVPPECAKWLPVSLCRSGERESLLDAAGPALPAGVQLREGTRLLELQGLCAFRAFSEVRLNSKPLEAPEPGVSARERGQLMHRALEELWRELRDSQRLQAMATQDLSGLIDRSVGNAAHALWGTVQSRVQVREGTRACELIAKLCALESERSAFRVRDIERAMSVTLASARLDLRIDRVDELDAGGLAILDYKTGARHSMEWYREHLSHPQLLAYLAAHEEDVSALATLTIRAAEMGFQGIARSTGLLPKVSAAKGPDGEGGAHAWTSSRQFWYERIEALVQDFLLGRAQVDPAPQACQNCDVVSLCRIVERGLIDEEELEEPTDE
jgi:probable DNA repair protein